MDDPSYVYKLCDNKWLVIMKKNTDTKTNESRSNCVDTEYAKFRASQLDVIMIINVNDGTNVESIDNTYINVYGDKESHIMYTVNKRVEADNFDTELNEVCSNGIHYFKSIKAAYFYRNVNKVPSGYTGEWYSWHDNGRKRDYGRYKNGRLIGSLLKWDYHGNGI